MNLRIKPKQETEYPNWLKLYTNECRGVFDIDAPTFPNIMCVDTKNGVVAQFQFIKIGDNVYPFWAVITQGPNLIHTDGLINDEIKIYHNTCNETVHNFIMEFISDASTNLVFITERSSVETILYLSKRYVK